MDKTNQRQKMLRYAQILLLCKLNRATKQKDREEIESILGELKMTHEDVMSKVADMLNHENKSH